MSVPNRANDFIRELCIAVAHRWEPERIFVILTSYFDESGTHDGSAATVMAAIMGSAKQWSRFQVELNRLKSRYGFSVFHTKSFREKDGDFAGWSNEKCLSLIGDLLRITKDGLMQASVLSLDNKHYDDLYRGGENPRKLRLDSRYGLCFRFCLLHQMSDVVRRLSHHKKFEQTRLHLVLESGPRNAGDAVRIFNEEAKAIPAGGVPLLADITFADKDKCDPLMIADFLAHTRYLQGPERQKVGVAPEGYKQTTGLALLTVDPDKLAELKKGLVSELEARRAYGASRTDRPVPKKGQPS